jgi:hypothetical protein
MTWEAAVEKLGFWSERGAWGRGVRNVAPGALALMLIACSHAKVPSTEAAVNESASGDSRVTTTAPSDLRRLSSLQIRRLIEGRTLSYVQESGVVVVTSQHRTTFFADGSVIVALDRASKRGRYRVFDDQLCVRFDSESKEECSLLFVSADKHYFVAPVSGGSIDQRPLKVIIE